MSLYASDSDSNRVVHPINTTSSSSTSKSSTSSQIQVTQPSISATVHQTSPGVQRRISIHVKVEDTPSNAELPTTVTTKVTEDQLQSQSIVSTATSTLSWPSQCLYRCSHTDGDRRNLVSTTSLFEKADEMLTKRSEESKTLSDLKTIKDHFDYSNNLFGTSYQPHNMQTFANRKSKKVLQPI